MPAGARTREPPAPRSDSDPPTNASRSSRNTCPFSELTRYGSTDLPLRTDELGLRHGVPLARRRVLLRALSFSAAGNRDNGVPNRRSGSRVGCQPRCHASGP